MTPTKPDTSPANFSDHDSRIQWNMTTSASGASVLKLSGDLKPGWLGKLSSHLSHQKINILRGSARKCSPLCWEASFEIEEKHKNSEPFKHFNPLPAVMGAAVHVDLPQLKISDFKLEHSPVHGGSIYTEITGKDCIGFLYGVLRIFSFYSLFPTELEISTSGILAHDKFWLKGIGASVPAQEDMTALHERLTMMLPA